MARAVTLIATVILYYGSLIAGGVQVQGLRGVLRKANLQEIAVVAAELGGRGTSRAIRGSSGAGASGGGETICTTHPVLTNLKTSSRY